MANGKEIKDLRRWAPLHPEGFGTKELARRLFGNCRGFLLDCPGFYAAFSLGHSPRFDIGGFATMRTR